MIIVCENCTTRFRLDEKRLPPEGARVRCSRCQHRFHVEAPSDMAPPSPSLDPPAASADPPEERGPEDSAEPSAPKAPGPDEEPDLENPEFLYDATTQDGRGSREADEEEAPPDAPAAPDGGADQWVDHEFGDLAGRETQAQPSAPAPETVEAQPSAPPPETVEDWGDDDSSFGALDPSGLDLTAPGSGGEDLEANATADPEPPPPPPSEQEAPPEPPTIAEPGAEFAAEAWGEEDLLDPGSGASDPLLGEPGPSLGEPDELSEPSEPPAPAISSELPVVSPGLPDEAQKTGLRARSILVDALQGGVPLWPAAVVLFALLALGGSRAAVNLVTGDTRPREIPEVAGWTASDLDALHLRDATGRRVLVVRGAIRQSGTGAPPELQLVLRDRSGDPIAAPSYAVFARLVGEDLSPAALTRRIEAGNGASEIRPVGGVSGFTLLVPDPPEAARSFRVSLVEP
jgi:predicted Zn finger-like uncharacterized protein